MKKRLMVTVIGLVLVITVVVFGRLFLVRTIEENYAVEPINISAGEALAHSGITHGTSILGINEAKAALAIQAAYPDNSVEVIQIERVFPSKVIIHLKERLPIAAIVTADNPIRYALADADFQYNKIVSDEEIGGYILITGVEVDTTFNTALFANLRQVFKAFIDLGTPDYALPALIVEIAFSKETITVIFKSGKSLSVPADASDIFAQIKQAYLLL